jgi:outer membrane protein OmpA-like peptidoglycan-associated protein
MLCRAIGQRLDEWPVLREIGAQRVFHFVCCFVVAITMSRHRSKPNLNARFGVDQQNFRIDLGKEVRLDSGSYTMSTTAGQFLRSYIPVLLHAKDTPEGQRWMRSVVVEGFTDEDGTYLYNLSSVLTAAEALTPEQLRRVQGLSSSVDTRSTP